MTNSKHDFIDFLKKIARCKADDQSLIIITEALQEKLLNFGSHTPDNLSCANSIELRIKNNKFGPSQSQSIAIKNSPYTISEILNSAEGCTIPAQVKEYCADLTQEQWDNTLRFTTLLVLSLEWDSNDFKYK